MTLAVISIIVFIIVVFVIIVIASGAGNINGSSASQTENYVYVPPQKAAGRHGEDIIENQIRSILHSSDKMMRNVELESNGSHRELDFVIVNTNGVYIIETKYYSGYLKGSYGDTWNKYHVSRGGNIYYKAARNPIAQAESQAGFLGRYLRSYGINCWVEGYAVILGADSPVSSERVLKSTYDIDRTIHTPGRMRLDAATVDYITILLS